MWCYDTVLTFGFRSSPAPPDIPKVIVMKHQWKSPHEREPMALLRPLSFYKDVAARLIDEQQVKRCTAVCRGELFLLWEKTSTWVYA